MGEPIRPPQHADTVAAAPISGVKPGSRRYRIRAAPHSLARTRQSIPQARSRQNALGRAPAPGQAKRRAVSVLGLVLVGIAALTSCIPARYGLSTLPSGNHPAYVTGATNGHLPASMLVDINPRCRVSGSMARPLVTMLQAAARAGVQLWTVSCYRTYQEQAVLRKRWCDAGQCSMAALPGTSNHGWGKAVDLGEPGGMAFTSRAHRWLSANAGKYGFVGLDSEAWHWDWVG